MTSFTIKLIAVLTMLADHIGFALFPEHVGFRIIGRLAFPLFAWLIAKGAYYTRNMRGYIVRLFAFACISQLPYALLFSSAESPMQLNIFFTLLTGLAAIILVKSPKATLTKVTGVMLLALAAELTHMSYGLMGVLSIVFFYLYFKQPVPMFLTQLVLNCFVFFIPFAIKLMMHPQTSYSIPQSYIVQPLAVFAVPIINFYNQKEGQKLKYLFYLFYPVHILILWYVREFFW